MKYFRVPYFILWTALLMTGCGVIDVDDSNPLLGTWFDQNFSYIVKGESDTLRVLSRLETTFAPNHKFERIRIELEALTGALIGYSFALPAATASIKSTHRDNREKHIQSAYSLEGSHLINQCTGRKLRFRIDGNRLVLIYPLVRQRQLHWVHYL
jgi:hypothetical protein